MPAYCFFDILEVTDRARMDDYKARVPAVVEKFGGRYLVAGGRFEVVEGPWRPVVPVILEFPSMEQARKWYDSEEYRELKALRLAACRCNAVFIEGR